MRTKDLIARRDKLLAEGSTISAGEEGVLSRDQEARVAAIRDEVKDIESLLARRKQRDERIVKLLVHDEYIRILTNEKKGTKH